MSQATTTLARIEELKRELATLHVQAIRELQAQRAELTKRVAAIDDQIEALTGALVEKSERESIGRSIPLSELKEILGVAPEKTLNIRKEGLQLENIKTLARVNPGLLRMGGKGAWPTVTLLK